MKKLIAQITRATDRKIRWLFLFSMIAFACFMGILYQQKKSQESTRGNIYASYTAIKRLEKINLMMLETESLNRGFLLSQDSYWQEALKDVRLQLMDSIRSYRLNSVASKDQKTFDTLERFMFRKLQYQDSFSQAGIRSAEVFQRIWNKEGGSGVTQTIKTILVNAIQDQERMLAEKIQINERSYKTGVVLALLGGMFAFVLVLIIIAQLSIDMRRRRKAEENLILSESKYRSLIENSGVVMFTTDVDGRITFTNSQAKGLTGYTAEELQGKHFSVLIDTAWIERVVSFYRNQFQKRIPATTLQFLSRTRSGEKVWVEQFAQLVTENDRITGFQCMTRDITEKKLIEVELNRSELQRKENEFRLNSIIENATTLVFIKNLDGRYALVNKRFKEMLGFGDKEIVGKTDYELVDKGLADHYQKLDKQVIATLKPVESEEVVETAAGKRNLLLVKFPLLDDKRKSFGIGGIATDITERVQSRIELEAALKNAEQAKELQEQFLANMSHEIRTPMNGIHGMTTLLLDTPLTDEQREFTVMIQRSVNNLTAIVNDILDVSNLKTGKLTLQKIIFNLNDPLEAVRAQFAHEAGAKGISFNITKDERVPSLLVGDPYRLKQVLISLLGNAVKFTKKGAISIHISMEGSPKEGVVEVLFRIADTGIGIAADKLDTIFESFAQANMEISRGYGGAGLGLYISKGLVQIQGGYIEAQSRPGEGSVFSFAIPYAIPEDAKNAGEEETFDTTTRLRDKRFLVVEDNEVNQKLISFVLQKAGGITDIAGNGKEAVALLEKGNRYDLVIMDLQMPVMDGYQTATYIRQQLKLDIPIIALTATALKGDQEKCRKVGMNDFMLKPFEFNDLYRRLLRLLYREEFGENESSFIEVQTDESLYDLSLLEELDDPGSLLDVITLFLQNTPREVKELQRLTTSRDWPSLHRLAHKIKGAVSILQALPLAKLLGGIEEKAREQKDLATIAGDVEQVIGLFNEMEMQLREVETRISRELREEK